MNIRAARPEEAGELTALAIRSKAYWGYDAGFMAACVPALTVTPQNIRDDRFFVLVDGAQIVAYASLRTSGVEAELTNLFVEPSAIRRGYGGRLWRHVVRAAADAGARRMLIESDPFAEAFYSGMGAERIGEVPSDAIPGRTIPLLVFTLPIGSVA